MVLSKVGSRKSEAPNLKLQAANSWQIEPTHAHYRFLTMKLARQLERRLEDALDGLAGRIFKGGLEVPELTARLAREAELAEFKTPAGPATANHFRLLINPANFAGRSERVSTELSNAFAEHAAERGWRLEGPVTVTIGPDPSVGVGSVTCDATVVPGQLSTWATLTGTTGQVVEVRPNRALIGRSIEADVIINAAEVSRHHALIYRQDGEAFALDLASANGTRIDGTTIKKSPIRLPDGSVLTLADLDFRFQVS